MNKFIGVGSLARDGKLNGGEKNVLRFTLVTLVGYSRKTEKEMWAFVPCVVFKPREETVNLLTEHTQGLLISLEGRVKSSKFESQGQTKYSTDVIVDENSIQVAQIWTGIGHAADEKAATA